MGKNIEYAHHLKVINWENKNILGLGHVKYDPKTNALYKVKRITDHTLKQYQYVKNEKIADVISDLYKQGQWGSGKNSRYICDVRMNDGSIETVYLKVYYNIYKPFKLPAVWDETVYLRHHKRNGLVRVYEFEKSESNKVAYTELGDIAMYNDTIGLKLENGKPVLGHHN